MLVLPIENNNDSTFLPGTCIEKEYFIENPLRVLASDEPKNSKN